MTRFYIPGRTTQLAINAAGFANRAAVALNGTATHDGLVSAEVALTRAMDEIRTLRPMLRQLKADVRRSEAAERVARRIGAREVMG